MLTIISPTYNSAKTISDCLESIVNQSHLCEHIIIDGGSSDNTVELARTLSPKSIIISEQDNGIYDAMNKGITLATGDVIGILNADDFYSHREVLERVSSIFADPSIDCCYGDLAYVDALDTKRIVRYWRSGNYRVGRFYLGWMPPHPTFFLRRSLYELLGTFRLDMGTSADYEFMLRILLKHGARAAYIPEILVKMRTGGASNASFRNRLLANRMDRLAWQVNGLRPYPWTLCLKPLLKLTQYFIRPDEPN